MKIGVFAKTYSGSDPLTVLTKVANAGYQTVAYNMVCSGLSSMPLQIPDSVISEIKSAVAVTGVEIGSLSGTYNMIHLSEQVRNDGLAALDALARLAVEIDCNFITLCTGTRCQTNQWEEHPDNNTEEAWNELLCEMSKAIAIADKYDIYLGIEPELANVVNSAAKAKRLIDELNTERVKVIFDPANLFEVATVKEQHQIIGEALDLLHPYIMQAHAKDRNADGSFGIAGQGVLDYDFYLNELRFVGYEGELIAHGFSEEYAQSVFDFLNEKLQ